MNERCDWCKHNKLDQTTCPECDSTIDIFDQTLCIGCLYHALRFEDCIIYCKICENYFASDDYEDCSNSNHEIIKDKKIIIQNIMNDYPQAKKFF
jgi:hypothetical protein